MSKSRAEIRSQYPANETPDKAIAAKLAAAANADKRIACHAVHKIAQELSCSPLKVGQTADLMEVRINRCQLGLFGRGKTAVPLFSIDEISAEMRDSGGIRCFKWKNRLQGVLATGRSIQPFTP